MRRLVAFLFFASCFAASAPAADWKEFAYTGDSFTVHFPGEPKIEGTTYELPGSGSLPARMYSVAQPTGTFKITVSEAPNIGRNDDDVIGAAVRKLVQGGEIKLDIRHRIRQVYGRQLAIAWADGSYSYAAVFFHNKRLYQIEGKAFSAGGEAEVEAMIFQQSLDLT
jgi:hypothetical protein